MTIRTIKNDKALNTLGLIICLATVPFLVGVTGCATSSRYTRNETEEIRDRDTSARVVAALADAKHGRYFSGVNVDTYKEVVQLSGFVNTPDLKNQAGTVARDAAGGREIRNNITVKE